MDFEIFNKAAVNPNLNLIALIFLIIFLFQLIFYGLIFPTIAILDLKKSDFLSKNQKVFWLISILLTWTFGAVIYGQFVSKNESFKIMAKIFLISVILQIALIGYLFFNCR